MAQRLPSFLPLPSFVPRAAGLVVLGLACTATLTYAAGRNLSTPKRTTAAVKTAAPAPVVVPDVQNQAFVFAKGSLEDAGFAWKVSGSVQGFAANTVASQFPAPGTKLYDTGSPLVTLTLKRNSGYAQTGEAEDVSPYPSTAVVPLATDGLGPAAPAVVRTPATTTPATTTPATTSPATTSPATTTPAAATPAPAQTAATTWPKSRPPAFTVVGGRKEPLDEMPLPDRAQLLGRWLAAHPARTQANVSHWLYQNAWIVAGAKLGWWHGAAALTTLVAVDRRTQKLWGIGAKSASIAQQALAEVRSRSS